MDPRVGHPGVIGGSGRGGSDVPNFFVDDRHGVIRVRTGSPGAIVRNAIAGVDQAWRTWRAAVLKELLTQPVPQPAAALDLSERLSREECDAFTPDFEAAARKILGDDREAPVPG